MLIRILTARGGYSCGAEVDVDDAVAFEWIKAGDAEAIGVPAPEGATASSGKLETAMKTKAAGR